MPDDAPNQPGDLPRIPGGPALSFRRSAFLDGTLKTFFGPDQFFDDEDSPYRAPRDWPVAGALLRVPKVVRFFYDVQEWVEDDGDDDPDAPPRPPDPRCVFDSTVTYFYVVPTVKVQQLERFLNSSPSLDEYAAYMDLNGYSGLGVGYYDSSSYLGETLYASREAMDPPTQVRISEGYQEVRTLAVTYYRCPSGSQFYFWSDRYGPGPRLDP